ncbi:molybdopterin-dependent oxidoreductase [Microbacterium resistens]|uniref:Molybdopterin-dependent oxidoreductase n=1 Tax=Microbacterium resistens TaxID=156977 RepID=A0ABY3RUL7_9MICO|nr:molybdopterin-dependent oxidoreductase [Microbacterium resistens]UGS26152.1 molybdopterin-dependent oxidoreductase [Microbacterium resistens]
MSTDAPDPPRALAAAAGIAGSLLGVGVGELAATLLAPASGPLAVVGGALIDAAPAWAKDAAIAWFGTADKAALLTGIALVLLAAAALAGIGEARWRRAGSVAVLLIGVGVGALALTRADAGAFAWVPAVLAGLVAAAVLGALVRALAPTRLPARAEPFSATTSDARTEGGHGSLSDGGSAGGGTVPVPRDRDAAGAGRIGRRGFLLGAGAAAVAGVVMTVAGSALRAGSAAVTAVRAAIRLPRPATPAPPIPPGAALDVPGLTPLITPNRDFYRIDTALVVPSIDPGGWRLRVHGMVDEEVELTWDELLALPLTESATTLSCVSNVVGGDLVGTAVWLGHPIRQLLARARPHPDADMVLSRSQDGFTAGTPLDALTDDRDALLAVGMNGEPLPPEHGFPVRMVVPGLYGYVSATKWVTELEVTRFDRARAYWTDRGWSARGPIKLQSRIDVPRRGRETRAGDAVIAGVAWRPGTGIGAVEVQVDDGPWQRAQLAPAISADTWVQWRLPWRAEPGDHRIRCRAIGADGEVQTATESLPAPDGATGWHTVRATVAPA